ncbi:cytochrome P450 [Cellulomonas fimi]|uniref:Putative cytochrome P450 n=1 Tax=Cellulomonas fimi (strain ATCC 484 / DSM 20113 / JCM 1341 / CCUG 24087 / LMG 16345 / NBRC 15513 / NCIMB 8980 / NCTC 7547 / NRS-133) TaxID=590998 RepID=F4H4T6_CELFA|nr:cytochrome P450 [Cellulomonas fimi]AEE44287.1 putative cytochrome P450 [Cellulomonas fimi ATCC 484]NNH05734.1 cytochrome P450 [Cellulomonas fimi]VEH26048.1 Biotin biosynthesis cytochrome P450 [Cellulomonas fimi]
MTAPLHGQPSASAPPPGDAQAATTRQPGTASDAETASGCPARRLTRPDDGPGPDLERVDDGRWRVRSFALARAVLRHPEGTRQAGFNAQSFHGPGGPRIRPPILYLEGEQHHAQRRAAARLFAPRTVEGYRPWMQEAADELVATVGTDRWTDVSRLAMQMAVRAASRVIGIDRASSPGMHRRLDTFFAPDPPAAAGPVTRARAAWRDAAMLRFYLLDVRPAIRARRRRRRDDLISRLLDDGFSDVDVLTECVTYAAAGMVTTRELITVAVWHLLDDAGLRARYRSSDAAGRVELLEEVLRLEPVVGHLLRETTAPLTLDGPDGPVVVPPGSVVDVDVRAVNADPRAAGRDGERLCPGRTLPRTVLPTLLSFGDGHHRCPGAPLAMLETEVLVSALLDLDLELAGPPRVRWNEVSAGYDLADLRVRRRAA